MMLFMRPRLYHDHKEFELQSLSFELVLTSRLVRSRESLRRAWRCHLLPLLGETLKCERLQIILPRYWSTETGQLLCIQPLSWWHHHARCFTHSAVVHNNLQLNNFLLFLPNTRFEIFGLLSWTVGIRGQKDNWHFKWGMSGPDKLIVELKNYKKFCFRIEEPRCFREEMMDRDPEETNHRIWIVVVGLKCCQAQGGDFIHQTSHLCLTFLCL